MAQVVWTLEAQRWLEDIFEFIASDNRQAAFETVQGIYEKAQVLRDHPDGHYRIAYLIKEDGDIDVLGVFHGALDISSYEF